ncbi:hypothetical protein N7454_009235, partial [Penicillium verhagenii]
MMHELQDWPTEVSPPGPTYMNGDQIDDLPPRASSAFSGHRPSEENPSKSNPVLATRYRIAEQLLISPRVTPPASLSPGATFNVYAEECLPGASLFTLYYKKKRRRDLYVMLCRGVNLEDDRNSHHSAAQDEATELVWMHQNPGMANKNPYAPYYNPDSEGRSSP